MAQKKGWRSDIIGQSGDGAVPFWAGCREVLGTRVVIAGRELPNVLFVHVCSHLKAQPCPQGGGDLSHPGLGGPHDHLSLSSSCLAEGKPRLCLMGSEWHTIFSHGPLPSSSAAGSGHVWGPAWSSGDKMMYSNAGCLSLLQPQQPGPTWAWSRPSGVLRLCSAPSPPPSILPGITCPS